MYVYRRQIEHVKSFKYLGSITESNGKMNTELKDKMGKTEKLFRRMNASFLGKQEILRDIKTELIQKVVRPTITYGSKIWAISAMEMRLQGCEENKTTRDIMKNDIQGV